LNYLAISASAETGKPGLGIAGQSFSVDFEHDVDNRVFRLHGLPKFFRSATTFGFVSLTKLTDSIPM
jgi:hypothetical protein